LSANRGCADVHECYADHESSATVEKRGALREQLEVGRPFGGHLALV
jgi:hypothetical protein